MKIIHTLVAFAVISCNAQLAYSADIEGHFWLGGGVGGVECPQFVASMEKARSLGIDSVGYVTEMQGFTMYLLGFQTSYNLSTKDTCDIFPEEKAYSLLSWVENYCRADASSSFVNAVIALSEDHHPKRLRICPK
jgi:hypothetical protein